MSLNGCASTIALQSFFLCDTFSGTSSTTGSSTTLGPLTSGTSDKKEEEQPAEGGLSFSFSFRSSLCISFPRGERDRTVSDCFKKEGRLARSSSTVGTSRRATAFTL